MSYELAKKFGPLHKPYVPANCDAEGYLEAEKPGLKHPAVRSSGRESTYRPRVADIAPRAGWSSSKSASTRSNDASSSSASMS